MAARFQGRVALVVGGAGRIGAAVARRLHAEGAVVVVADLDAEAAASTGQELGGWGWGVDVTDLARLRALVARIVERHGQLDAVCSTAGMLTAEPLEDLELDVWRRCLEVNLTGCLAVAKASAPALADSGSGSLVLTSSTSGLVGSAGQIAYCATKSGIVGLTRALADELASRAVRVNCVCPGWVDTPFNDPVWRLTGGQAGSEAELLASVPLRRQAHPDEVGATAAFLLSDDASYMTGTALVVDGGLTAVR